MIEMSSLAYSQKETWSCFTIRKLINLGAGKFEPLWMGPYIVKRVLAKGAYELVDYDGIPLSQPRNGLYLKRYYA